MYQFPESLPHFIGFLHVVRVCKEGFDYRSLAKRSPFPPPSYNNMQ